MDYYALMNELLGTDRIPTPQELMEGYAYRRDYYKSCPKLVDEEDSENPKWRMFKVKDVYFRIRCGYSFTYGYLDYYEFEIVKPVEQTITVRTWATR